MSKEGMQDESTRLMCVESGIVFFLCLNESSSYSVYKNIVDKEKLFILTL